MRKFSEEDSTLQNLRSTVYSARNSKFRQTYHSQCPSQINQQKYRPSLSSAQDQALFQKIKEKREQNLKLQTELQIKSARYGQTLKNMTQKFINLRSQYSSNTNQLKYVQKLIKCYEQLQRDRQKTALFA